MKKILINGFVGKCYKCEKYNFVYPVIESKEDLEEMENVENGYLKRTFLCEDCYNQNGKDKP